MEQHVNVKSVVPSSRVTSFRSFVSHLFLNFPHNIFGGRIMFLRLALAFLLICFYGAHVAAWPRLGASSTAVFKHTGDRANGFSVSVSTGTSVRVYEGTDEDREIFFQNLSSDYDIHCGTFSAVNDSVGTDRWVIRASQDVTSNGTYDVYCVAEDSAGSGTVEVVGNIEYDHKD